MRYLFVFALSATLLAFTPNPIQNAPLPSPAPPVEQAGPAPPPPPVTLHLVVTTPENDTNAIAYGEALRVSLVADPAFIMRDTCETCFELYLTATTVPGDKARVASSAIWVIGGTKSLTVYMDHWLQVFPATPDSYTGNAVNLRTQLKTALAHLRNVIENLAVPPASDQKKAPLVPGTLVA